MTPVEVVLGLLLWSLICVGILCLCCIAIIVGICLWVVFKVFRVLVSPGKPTCRSSQRSSPAKGS